MTPETWVMLKAFLWMFGIPLLVWFLKDLQVERQRERLYKQWDAAEERATRNLWLAIHFQKALQMIASSAVSPAKLAFDALKAAEKKDGS